LTDAALVVADHEKPASAIAPASFAENRHAKREAVTIGGAAGADEHDGRQLAAADTGFEIVPASEKPLLGMLTRSSFGREMVTVREETAAMSSRTTSSDCPGALSRIIRPVSSDQIVISTGRPGSASVTRVLRAAIKRAVV
jgi:hypothetical protein